MKINILALGLLIPCYYFLMTTE